MRSTFRPDSPVHRDQLLWGETWAAKMNKDTLACRGADRQTDRPPAPANTILEVV